jgi:adenosyl cobinamide kinase/adenosyl cobinamide phosphate guanylyltransferase
MSEQAYELRTADNVLVAIKHRRDTPDGKTFWFTRPDGTPGLNGQSDKPMPLYRSEHHRDSDSFVIVEGEKAADALAAQGIPALGTSGASSTPPVEALEFLRDKRVVLWPDNDDVGRQHMRRVAERLHAMGVEVRMVNPSMLPAKADAADVDPAHLQSYLDSAEVYETPEHERDARPHIYNNNDLKTMYTRISTRKWDAQMSGRRLHLDWGFERLDKVTDGIHPGLIALHGPPGVGKSAWALQVAQQVDAPVLYLTAEMAIEELVRRMVARTARKPMGELLSATLSREEEAMLVSSALDTSQVRFVDASTTQVSLAYMVEVLTDLRKVSRDGHAMLIVDSLHTWINQFLAEAEDGTEYNAINYGVNELRRIANHLSIPVMIVCERNRASMADGGLSAVAGSRTVEYRSDIVFGMDKASEQHDDHGIVKDITLSVLKNRSGGSGVELTYSFNGSYMGFWEQ